VPASPPAPASWPRRGISFGCGVRRCSRASGGQGNWPGKPPVVSSMSWAVRSCPRASTRRPSWRSRQSLVVAGKAVRQDGGHPVRVGQPCELCYAPLMHERAVADDLMAGIGSIFCARTGGPAADQGTGPGFPVKVPGILRAQRARPARHPGHTNLQIKPAGAWPRGSDAGHARHRKKEQCHGYSSRPPSGS
jgi:hypothetical protein